MGVKLKNNAFGTLSAGISSSATTITLDSGQGAKFPTTSTDDYFYATLIDSSNNVEVVKVTTRSSDSMTVTRAQDNTSARTFSLADRFGALGYWANSPPTLKLSFCPTTCPSAVMCVSLELLNCVCHSFTVIRPELSTASY